MAWNEPRSNSTEYQRSLQSLVWRLFRDWIRVTQTAGQPAQRTSVQTKQDETTMKPLTAQDFMRYLRQSTDLVYESSL